MAQACVFLGKIVFASLLLLQLIPLFDFIVIREIFFRWVVTFIVLGKLHLWSGNMHDVVLTRSVVIAPQVVKARLFILWFVRNDAALANGTYNLHDLLCLPLGRNESTLWLRTGTQGHDFGLGGEPFDGRFIRVVSGVRNDTSLKTLDDVQFLIIQHNILAFHLALHRLPRIRIFHGGQEFVEFICSGGFQNLFTINIVTNMRKVVVPFKWYVSNGVFSLFGR
jgi:hypothetical protein